MDILLAYFSRTGNTEKLAKAIENEAPRPLAAGSFIIKHLLYKKVLFDLKVFVH